MIVSGGCFCAQWDSAECYISECSLRNCSLIKADGLMVPALCSVWFRQRVWILHRPWWLRGNVTLQEVRIRSLFSVSGTMCAVSWSLATRAHCTWSLCLSTVSLRRSSVSAEHHTLYSPPEMLFTTYYYFCYMNDFCAFEWKLFDWIVKSARSHQVGSGIAGYHFWMIEVNL